MRRRRDILVLNLACAGKRAEILNCLLLAQMGALLCALPQGCSQTEGSEQGGKKRVIVVASL